MDIKSNIKSYHVRIENDFTFISELLKAENAFFVIDKNLYEQYTDLFFKIPSDKLMVIEATEENKTIDTVMQISEAMTSIPAKRNAVLISFGGGVIQDITGFVASILYRGIQWIFVPTTLLAACDSCIGSKTSLNYKRYKNLLGTFFPPNEIHICSQFFRTLTEKDFKSGLGEVVKFNILSGYGGLKMIEEDINLLLNREQEALDKYVLLSLKFKKPFIETDEFDKGVRLHLNFAHTFGHAIETVSNYQIPHGTAVAMGMIVANKISLIRGYIDENTVLRTENVLRQIINTEFVNFTFDVDKLIDAIRKDKKQTSAALTAVLICNDMKLAVFKDLTTDELINSLEYMHNLLKSGL